MKLPRLVKGELWRGTKNMNHFRTTIKPTSDLDRNEFIWFDIVPDDMEYTERSRFCYKGDIVNGLNQFKQTLAFCLKPKNNDTPIRKQKRND